MLTFIQILVVTLNLTMNHWHFEGEIDGITLSEALSYSYNEATCLEIRDINRVPCISYCAAANEMNWTSKELYSLCGNEEEK